jgi:hypothetical protein
MSEWDNLKTYDDWKGKLEDLLDEGRKASAADDDESRLELCSRLRMFVQKSRPNTPEVLDLDRIASEATRTLSLDVAEGAVDRIEARTAELIVLGKTLQQVAAQAESDAASLRLEKAHAAIDAIIGVQRALDDFDSILQSGTDEEIGGRIKEVLGILKKLRDTIEKKS